jgi:dolichol-phosphate mannosyltransferase
MIVIAVYSAARLTVGQDWPAGFTTLSVLVLVSTSLNALFFGIMGEYIGRIYRQVKKQPLTIVESKVNVADEGSSDAGSVAIPFSKAA